MIRYVIHAVNVPRLLRLAAMLSLLGLGLIMWGMFDPRPAPVLIGLSVGQAIGTSSFLLYLAVVVWEIRRKPRPGTAAADEPKLEELR